MTVYTGKGEEGRPLITWHSLCGCIFSALLFTEQQLKASTKTFHLSQRSCRISRFYGLTEEKKLLNISIFWSGVLTEWKLVSISFKRQHNLSCWSKDTPRSSHLWHIPEIITPIIMQKCHSWISPVNNTSAEKTSRKNMSAGVMREPLSVPEFNYMERKMKCSVFFLLFFLNAQVRQWGDFVRPLLVSVSTCGETLYTSKAGNLAFIGCRRSARK